MNYKVIEHNGKYIITKGVLIKQYMTSEYDDKKHMYNWRRLGVIDKYEPRYFESEMTANDFIILVL